MRLWVTAHGRISPLRPLNPWHHIADFVTHSEGMLREESGLLYTNAPILWCSHLVPIVSFSGA